MFKDRWEYLYHPGVGTGPRPCPGKFLVEPQKLSPGIPRPANLSPSPRSRIFQFWVPVPVPNPGFSEFASVSLPSASVPKVSLPSPGFLAGSRKPRLSLLSRWSRIFQISVPVPVPDPANFEFESRSQSPILKWVPISVPDFWDRDCGISGTLSRMPTQVCIQFDKSGVYLKFV